MDNYEITLSEYWRIIKNRKWIIIYTFGSILLSTVIFTKLQTPIYSTVTEIRIEKRTTAPSMFDPWATSSNLATEIRVIKSLPIVKSAVERVEVLPSAPEERERVLYSFARKYQGIIKVSQIENTNILRIEVKLDDPLRAAMLANAIADVYIERNVAGGSRQSEAVLEYAQKQLVRLEEKIEQKEAELQKVEQNERIFLVTPEVKAALDRMTIERTFEFENELLKVQSRLTKLNRIIERKKENGKLPFLSINEISEDFIIVGLKRRLLELEFGKFLLLIDYTPDHPTVLSQNEVIADTKNKMVRMIKKFIKVPLNNQSEEDLSLLINELFVEARKEVLYRIVNKFYYESGSLSPDQLKYQKLKRSIGRALETYNRILDRKDDAEISVASEIADISVVSPAVIPKRPIKPVAEINYLVGSVAGLLFGLMLAFVVESMDTSLGAVEEIERLMRAPVLGVIPYLRTKKSILKGKQYETKQGKVLRLRRERVVTIFHPTSREAESVRTLRINLIQKMKMEKNQVVLFTSADQREGKSTVSSNLAMSMAQLGKKTVLVGANLRRPTIYKLFGVDKSPGLTDILIGRMSWQEVIKSPADILVGDIDMDKFLQTAGIDNFYIITSGHVVSNPSEILHSQRLEGLLEELKKCFEIVIVDCAPVLPVADSIILSSKVDGIVVVYKVGTTKKEMLRRASAHLAHARANVLGVVLNQVRTAAQMGSSVYYNHYYEEGAKAENSVIRKLLARFKR